MDARAAASAAGRARRARRGRCRSASTSPGTRARGPRSRGTSTSSTSSRRSGSSLDGSLGPVSVTSDPQAEAIIASAKNAPSVLPIVHNAHDGLSDGPLADNLLLNPAARTALVTNLVNLAKSHGYAGYVFDFENISPRRWPQYPALIAQARAALKPIGREVWVSLPFANPDCDLKKFQAVSDTVVLMAYDQHWGGDGRRSPASPARRPARTGTRRTSQRDMAPARSGAHRRRAGRLRLRLDAGQGRQGDQGRHRGVLRRHPDRPRLRRPGQPRRRRAQPDLRLRRRRRDASTSSGSSTPPPSSTRSRSATPTGRAATRCGAWAPRTPASGASCASPMARRSRPAWRRSRPAPASTSTAQGEVLHVGATPTAGKRTIEIDPDNGLISGEDYKVMPTSYVIAALRLRIPDWVALTFDDGPDGRWTPKILDILKAKHAPATFFVIGENMQAKPGPGAARGARGRRGRQPHLDPPQHRRDAAGADRPGAQHHPAPVRGADRQVDAPLPAALFRRRRAVDAERGRAAAGRPAAGLSTSSVCASTRTTGRLRQPNAICPVSPTARCRRRT